jgi:xylulokinase
LSSGLRTTIRRLSMTTTLSHVPGAYVIGVDLGTSVVKATLVTVHANFRSDAGPDSSAGSIVTSASRTVQMYHPGPGQAEQDPEAFVAAALSTIGEVVGVAEVNPHAVAAVAISGQMGGAMAIDRQGKALTPWYPSTLDVRYQPYLQPVMAVAGPRVLSLAGAVPIMAPRIAWWRAEMPALYDRIDKVLLLANYVAARLCSLAGDAICCDASYLTWTGLADTAQRTWSAELADLWGVSLDRLPRIVAASDLVGRLSSEAAAQCGLCPGTPLVAGAGDQVAGFLGAGLVEPGQLIDVAGTFPVFATCIESCLVDGESGILQPLAGPLGDRHWYALMYIGGGGLTHQWFARQYGLFDMPDAGHLQSEADTRLAFAQLDALAADLPPGAQGMLFIPHLLGRACPPDPAVRGAWLGFTWTHGPQHFYRALLEAIAYDYAQALAVLRQAQPALPYDAVRVIGGGSRSTVWNQIKADVLGLPYARMPEVDRAALGCAILAGYGAGIYTNMAAVAHSFARPRDVVSPRPEWHAYYQGYVDVYCQAFDQLRGIYTALGALSRRPWPPQQGIPPSE